jgi:hypothetical protein
MKLFVLDTMLNTAVDGSLWEQTPWVFLWTKERDYENVPVGQWDHFALEAWERQTMGGIVNEAGPGIYSLQDCDSTCEKERIS